MKRKTRKDQCYVFDLMVFRTKKGVKDWMAKENIKIPKGGKVRKFDVNYRVKIRACHKFKHLRETKLRNGVCVVRGYIK